MILWGLVRFFSLIVSLYNIVDSFWVAKLGTQALTAVSLAFPLQNVIVAAGVGLILVFVHCVLFVLLKRYF